MAIDVPPMGYSVQSRKSVVAETTREMVLFSTDDGSEVSWVIEQLKRVHPHAKCVEVRESYSNLAGMVFEHTKLTEKKDD
jgi:hypothetical protein